MAQRTNLKTTIKQNKPVTEVIRKYANLLKKEGVKVDKMILFGSYAKGKARKWSDIDLCVVSSEFGKRPCLEMRRLNNLALKIDDRLQPIPLNYDNLNEKYSTLAHEIRKSGMKVGI